VDVAVVGGGAMGAASAWALARRGREVTLFERFEIGHRNGSSHGPSRIFRLAYVQPDYVRMAQLAVAAWRDLEDVAGERLLTITGGLDLGPGAFIAAESLDAVGVPFRWLTPEAARDRWPDVRLPAGERALFQESGAWWRPTRPYALWPGWQPTPEPRSARQRRCTPSHPPATASRYALPKACSTLASPSSPPDRGRATCLRERGSAFRSGSRKSRCRTSAGRRSRRRSPR